MPKNYFEKEFCMRKGGNPNILKLKIKQICGKILRVWHSAMHKYNLFWFGAFQMKSNQFGFISEKIVTSLADIFTMEKGLFKIIFWHKIFIC